MGNLAVTGIADLPTEILDMICATITDPIDVAALTYSFRRIYLLAETKTFNTVVIKSRTQNIAFQSALRTRSQRAAGVRHLIVDRFQSWIESRYGDTDNSVEDDSKESEENDVNEEWEEEEEAVWDDSDSEICTLPLLVNLRTYRVAMGQPEQPKPIQTMLETAACGFGLSNLKTCSITLLFYDDSGDNSGNMCCFGSVFAIPSIEEITIRRCSASDFTTSSLSKLDAASHHHQTSLRKLYWLGGGLSADALNQILAFPRRLEELSIEAVGRYMAPDVRILPEDWNSYIDVICKHQPWLQSLCLRANFTLNNTWSLQLNGLLELLSLSIDDTMLFSQHVILDQAGAPVKNFPPNLRALRLTSGYCKPFDDAQQLLCTLLGRAPFLRHLTYSVTNPIVPPDFREACDKAGVTLDVVKLATEPIF